jgi:hypothetical protein
MDPQDEVTVFRSAEPSALEEATEVLEILQAAGVPARLLTARDAGVPIGACEVRVPAGEEARAEAVLREADATGEAQEPVDNSEDMDLEVLVETVGATAEMEALAIRSVLEANAIPVVLVQPGPYPNLPFIVKVPRNRVEEARQVLAEAREAGPLAAEEAERSQEAGG